MLGGLFHRPGARDYRDRGLGAAGGPGRGADDAGRRPVPAGWHRPHGQGGGTRSSPRSRSRHRRAAQHVPETAEAPGGRLPHVGGWRRGAMLRRRHGPRGPARPGSDRPGTVACRSSRGVPHGKEAHPGGGRRGLADRSRSGAAVRQCRPRLSVSQMDGGRLRGPGRCAAQPAGPG